MKRFIKYEVNKKLSRQFLKNKNKKEWRKKNVEKTKLKLRVLFDKKQKIVLGFIQMVRMVI